MLTGLRRIVRAGFVGFWRNAFISFTSIIVMVVALFVIASTLFNTHSLESALNDFQDRVDINLYFVPDASVDEIDRIRSSVAALPDVAAVTYTSREDALEEYRARNQDNEIALQALEELNENPLGATIAIQAKETSQYEAVAQYLDEQKAQEEVGAPVIDVINFNRNKEAIDRLSDLIITERRQNEVISIILIVIAALVMFNTVKLAIYNSREEISVMRLVGASNAYITMPFVIVGVMQGLIAGVVVLLLLYPALLWDETLFYPFPFFNDESVQEFLFNYFVSDFATIFLVVVGGGILISAFSSFLAVRKYLKV
jgi:cell division transport system permease protein